MVGPLTAEETLALIDRIVARLITVTGRAHVPGWNGIVLTPDEIRDVLTEVLT